MPDCRAVSVSRRNALRMGAMAGVALSLREAWAAADPMSLPLITKPVPKTGEMLPVIGIGTNEFRPADYADLRQVLERMHEAGGTVIDTAAGYGESETVIGRALAELKLRNSAFISTKFNVSTRDGQGSIDGRASFERSLKRLQTNRIDLLEVHSLEGLQELMPLMQEYKKAGRVRYIGATTFRDEEHDQLAEVLRKFPLDFVQLNYSLGNRRAAEKLLPLAIERKVAVMVDVPLGGGRGSLFQEVGSRVVPAWAAEFNAASWGQFFLKYVVSHPAVTCAIPGSTKVSHLLDNQAAGHGRLPTAAERKRMETFWDSAA